MYRGLEVMQKFSQWVQSPEGQSLSEEEVGKAFVSLLDEALLSNYEEGQKSGARPATASPMGALAAAGQPPAAAGPAMA
jgi:hypothetical protein